ncbi:MAG: putative cytochrome oxidase assembly protein [Propionibacteriaceae bacterium]|jgi:cytochrome c oxidase assembly protein subunit 15|nr:putative cytochrome oxidase assembly protein [Propionibacteriaceae bacterium]
MDVVKQLPAEADAVRSGGLLPAVLRVVRGPYALRGWSIVSLVMNIVIVVTGGLVRLTGSGLGCPTWPRCTEDSYVSHPELGIHGAIEFGNRLFTLVLIIAAALTLVSAMLYRDNGRPRPDLRWLAGGLALGIPLQGVIGGITVLTQLNPYVVGLHLLLSMVLIALAVWLVRKAWHLVPARVSGLSVAATRVTFVLMWLAIWLGTLVTGSGPHAGDENAPRNGLDAMLLTRLHTSVVYATVAASVVCFVLLRSKAVVLLLLIEIVQAGIGIVQYQLGLPIWLVALHLLGASLAIAATTNLVLSVSRR